jgi:SAM-dependent methyltransferase
MEMSSPSQRYLTAEQVEAFFHDEFVADQVRDFRTLVGDGPVEGKVVDMGGGVGHFAASLKQSIAAKVRVVDMDPASVEQCRAAGLDAAQGDALNPVAQGDEQVVCFNLILHHLVADSEAQTRALQTRALTQWAGKVPTVFVNEYIYESMIPGFSGRFIFEITSSRILSTIAKAISRVVPPLRANTFGVGVRFRSRGEWHKLFEEAGFRVVKEVTGAPEPISLVLRGLLIKTIRRDSFALAPLATAGAQQG